MARVGIFSGTFDPVHKGHIAFCRKALAAGLVDRVVLLPEPEPRGKAHAAPLPHRVAMLTLALGREQRMAVVQLPGRRFNVAETLPELERRFAGDKLFLLLGSDVVRTFDKGWPGLDALLGCMELVIGLRGHDTAADMHQLLQAVAEQAGVMPRYDFVGSPHAHTASSRIRGQLPSAEVAPPVAAYIAEHQLYAAPA